MILTIKLPYKFELTDDGIRLLNVPHCTTFDIELKETQAGVDRLETVCIFNTPEKPKIFIAPKKGVLLGVIKENGELLNI